MATSPKKRAPARGYHHGALRQALLEAAEAELAEAGLDGMSLRGCARRASVSHAAPAHHFNGLPGLLSELAATGFERLSASIRAASSGLAPGSLDDIVACAIGYVRFARANPHLFRLMFRQEKLDPTNTHVVAAGQEAFALPVAAVAAHSGVENPMAEPGAQSLVVALWSLSHGMADLMVNGQLCNAGGKDPEEWLRAQLHFALEKTFAGGTLSKARRAAK